MSDSIQLAPAIANTAQSSPVDPAAGKGLAEDSSKFKTLLTNYDENNAATSTAKIDRSVFDLSNQNLPQAMLTTGNSLPQDDSVLAWQSAIAMQPSENILSNSVELQKNYLLDLQRKAEQQTALQNNSLLNQQYLQKLNSNALSTTAATNNISSQLAAGYLMPEKNDVFLLNTNEPFMSILGTNTGIHQTASGVALATSIHTTNTQAPPLNLSQNAWESNLGTRLQMLVGQNVQLAEIRLDPPELGILDIKIKVINDVATISITSPHAQVRDALETSIPRLREMFAESGLSLGDVNVRQESFSNQQGFEGETENQLSTMSDADDEPIAVKQIIEHEGLLDIYA